MKTFLLVIYLTSNGQVKPIEYAIFSNPTDCNWSGNLISAAMEYEMDGIISVAYSCSPFNPPS